MYSKGTNFAFRSPSQIIITYIQKLLYLSRFFHSYRSAEILVYTNSYHHVQAIVGPIYSFRSQGDMSLYPSKKHSARDLRKYSMFCSTGKSFKSAMKCEVLALYWEVHEPTEWHHHLHRSLTIHLCSTTFLSKHSCSMRYPLWSVFS